MTDQSDVYATRPEQYLDWLERKLNHDVLAELRRPFGTPAERAQYAVLLIEAHIAQTEKFSHE